ncbi:hypothetical protein [Christiangramia aquimixticola]|uniref:hypothetical protein n=1 Tax=Christiangramia aquimixticola TaxID=1697558 RepID=UPI003AA87050
MKSSNKIAVGVLIGIAVLALGLLVANNILEAKIKKGIEANLDNIQATYRKVDVKILNRSAEVFDARLSIKGKQLSLDLIRLENINLYEYIVNKNVEVGKLIINDPNVKIFDLPSRSKDSIAPKKSKSFKNKIFINKVNINGGSLKIFEKDSLQHRLFAKIRAIDLKDVLIDSASLKAKLPFIFSPGQIKIDSIFYDLDQLQVLSTGKIQIKDQDLGVKNLQILPKYSKAGHQKYLKNEKDRYILKIDSLALNSFKWDPENEESRFQSENTLISNFHFEIYRDKLKPDETSYKSLYSKMLRDLPIKLKLDHVKLVNGYLKYEERLHANREPGVVDFSNLNGEIENITNFDLDRKDFPTTRVRARANFMKSAPLSIDWSFKVNNKSDYFRISGEMGNLSAEQMNQFLKPAMNVEAHGEILKMNFVYTGNSTKATGDMRLEYKDFKVEVLQKDKQKKNKLVSALANLLVKNKALNDKAEYKEITYERDQTKSFWNYFWNLIRKGAMKTFL